MLIETLAPGEEVHSIVFLSDLPPGQLDGKVVAMPSASATSVVLLKILLRKMWDVAPAFRWFDQLSEDPFAGGASAALFIGDVALSPDGRLLVLACDRAVEQNRIEVNRAGRPVVHYSFTPEVVRILRRTGTALVISDAADWPMWDAVTTDLVYIRLHGHTRTYASKYSAGALRVWARRIRRWRGQGHTVHVYFDNDADGHAPYDALRLKKLLAESMMDVSTLRKMLGKNF
mgnify:CR=1 FL=1